MTLPTDAAWVDLWYFSVQKISGIFRIFESRCVSRDVTKGLSCVGVSGSRNGSNEFEGCAGVSEFEGRVGVLAGLRNG